MQWADHPTFETQDTQMAVEKPLDLSLRPSRNDVTTSPPSPPQPSIPYSSSIPPFTSSSSLGIPRSQQRLSPYPSILSQSPASSRRLGSPCPAQSRSPLTRPISPYYSFHRQTPSPYYPYPLSRSCTPPDNVTSLHALSSSHLINALVSSTSSRSLDSGSPQDFQTKESPRLKSSRQSQKQDDCVDPEQEEPTYIDMDSSTPVKSGASSRNLHSSGVFQTPASYVIHQSQSSEPTPQKQTYYHERDNDYHMELQPQAPAGTQISTMPSSSFVVRLASPVAPPVTPPNVIPLSTARSHPPSSHSQYGDTSTGHLCDSTHHSIMAECTSTTNSAGAFRTYYNSDKGKLVVDIGEYNISHHPSLNQFGTETKQQQTSLKQRFSSDDIVSNSPATSSARTTLNGCIPSSDILSQRQSPQISPDSNTSASSTSLSSSCSSITQNPSNKENSRVMLEHSNNSIPSHSDKRLLEERTDLPPQNSLNGDQAQGSFKTLDFWLKKIYMDDSTRQRCGAEIRQPSQGTTPKIRLRLDDLLDLQLKHSLKA